MPAQKKHTNCVLCGVSLAAYPRHRTYCPTCARRAHPSKYKSPEEKREYKPAYIPNYNMAPAAKPARPKYTGPSAAEIDAEAKKLGISYGKYVLMLQQERI